MQVVRYGAGAWGVGELWFEDDAPVWHELPTWARELEAHPPKGGTSPPSVTLAGADARPGDDSVPELARRVARYFSGAEVSFADVELDLEWCTPFQRSVAEALRTVAYGETVTYGELAALAGHPNAQRAAGTFCAHNRLPLILPCHRVVAAAGLGSYGSLGTDYKRRLLEFEHAAL
jgi:methylated-DNA-[protein]-cysteine S-methyltransferase